MSSRGIGPFVLTQLAADLWRKLSILYVSGNSKSASRGNTH